MRKRRLLLHLGQLAVVACMVMVLLHSDQIHTSRAGAARTSSTAGWTTRGADILTPSGTPFVIAGISWYGIETPRSAPFGLDTQDYMTILNESKLYQFNTLRIPISNATWETNAVPDDRFVRACTACQNVHVRDILALIINYAGSIGMHVILDDHRSESGSSASTNGLWYNTGSGLGYTEQNWIKDWVDIQSWIHGVRMPSDPLSAITVHDVAADGYPTVIGYDLRNEPHVPPNAPYSQGATWGSGDGIDPHVNPNPNPFTPACVATSTCHDWRLAAERAGDSILGDAAQHRWPLPLIFVQGVNSYPTASGTAAHGPYDLYRWGGLLEGVNGNANNPGAPIVLNAGGTALRLGPAVSNQLVYVTRDYGPTLSPTDTFAATTCYRLGCAPKGSVTGLVNLWCQNWAYINLPPGQYGACTGGVQPHGWTRATWNNTGSVPYTQAPIWIGEFGTGNTVGDLVSPTPGSQGQWFTDLINFIQSSYVRTALNDSGIPVHSLSWTYWALNSDDDYSLLGTGFTGLANPSKQYSFLCFILPAPPRTFQPQRPCGFTGALPPAR